MSLDWSENLPKERRSQVAFGELQGAVPRMPDEASAGLEEPLLQARQGPALNGAGQDQLAQESRVQWVAALPSLIHGSAAPRPL
jgi:hypothetical protein